MKKFKAWRYKCDFCGKNGRSSFHMRNHELGCTANPNRVCKVHQYVDYKTDLDGNPIVPSVSYLVDVLRSHWNDEDHGVSALRECADGCPCCMLAAIRQSRASKGYSDFDEEGYTDTPPWIGPDRFDFKAEMKSLWDDVNESVRDHHDY